MSTPADYQWIPQDDPNVRAEHRVADRASVWGTPAPPMWYPPCRCYTAPLPKTRYPKRWSRAKRKAARAREARAVDRAVARALAVVRKFRRET